MNWALYDALMVAGIGTISGGIAGVWNNRNWGKIVVFLGIAVIVLTLLSPLVPLLFFY